MKPKCIALLLLVLSANLSTSLAANTPREKFLLDEGWKFHLGDEWPSALRLDKAGASGGPAGVSFGDTTWRVVNLPHDWAVELPFDSSADSAHGFHTVGPGFPKNSVAWYRRKFDLPREDAGKRLWLEFDGVFRDCTVFVNGWIVGHHESGYSSFRYDITDVANYGGKNVISVRVDASKFEGWFYEGAGIYRHVWLEKTAPLSIAPDGIFVRFDGLKTNGTISGKTEAPLHIEARVENSQNEPVQLKLTFAVFDQNNKVAEDTLFTNLTPWSESTLQLDTTIASPLKLWTPETPNLYRLVTTAEAYDQSVDQTQTEFGLRTVAFDPDKGFLLNGQPYVLKGTCNHQDHAGVGAAMPDALQYFRVKKLKEFGCNAIRTSHNPPTPELLEACDQLGMIVMDESRLLGSDAQNLARWRSQIRRDRNHPSVCIWSVANEEFYTQSSPQGVRAAETMQRLVKQLDPTRPVTYAAPVGDEFAGNINSIIQVRGWNYHTGGDMDKYHSEHPQQPQVGTEQGSTVSTRGIYTNDAARGYVSAYDVGATSWSSTAERWWSYFAERPWLSGGFVWTGFDYRGEPTPYSWPCINSHFGLLDMCGFFKDNAYYYQSVWTDKPMVHLLPHWNWPGREGQEISVWSYSNAKEVELFLNGQSLGRKMIPKNLHAEWNVKYAPGILSAKAFDASGKIIAETKVETAGEPAAIQLTPDRATIAANGEDISLITVSVTDAQGRVVPLASNKIHFELTGPGKILGVGNGDPSSHEPDQFISVAPFRTKSITDWRWKQISDAYKPNQPEMAPDFNDSSWPKIDVLSENGPLTSRAAGAFRAQIEVTAEDLAGPSVELDLGRIDDEGSVYVNGQKVGESHDWQVPASFDVKKFLHPGNNTIAVLVANWDGPGGIGKGVELLFAQKAPRPDWQRSVFNGVAQFIVQSTKQAGEISVTASGEGLKTSVLKLTTQTATSRPAIAAE